MGCKISVMGCDQHLKTKAELKISECVAYSKAKYCFMKLHAQVCMHICMVHICVCPGSQRKMLLNVDHSQKNLKAAALSSSREPWGSHELSPSD